MHWQWWQHTFWPPHLSNYLACLAGLSCHHSFGRWALVPGPGPSIFGWGKWWVSEKIAWLKFLPGLSEPFGGKSPLPKNGTQYNVTHDVMDVLLQKIVDIHGFLRGIFLRHGIWVVAKVGSKARVFLTHEWFPNGLGGGLLRKCSHAVYSHSSPFVYNTALHCYTPLISCHQWQQMTLSPKAQTTLRLHLLLKVQYENWGKWL